MDGAEGSSVDGASARRATTGAPISPAKGMTMSKVSRGPNEIADLKAARRLGYEVTSACAKFILFVC